MFRTVVLPLIFVCVMIADAAAADIQKLFNSEMIGSQLSYFESLAGPAWKAFDNYRIYRIGACQLAMGVEDNTVQYLEANLSPQCPVHLQSFLPYRKLPKSSTFTFGEFERAHQKGHIQANCIYLCGNAEDPVVYEFWWGPHANGFIDIRIGAVLTSNAAIDASNKLAEAIKRSAGEEYLNNTRFNCDDRFEDIAHRLFSEVKITLVQVGRKLPSVGHPCNPQ